MRIILAGFCAAYVLAASVRPASAEEACARDALGVARVAEIDTTGGPWFGTPQGNPDFLSAGEVVLTFDDGPVPKYTRPILAALAAQCVKATFFLVGEMVAEYPDAVKEIADQGHTIGTHTWTHANLKRLSEEKAQAQIESTFTATEKAAGQPIAPFFRYPFLNSSPSVVAYLQSRNVAQFAIDIDSFDWRTRDPQSVTNRVMAGLERRGKGIVLFHDIHAATMRALPGLLSALKAKGYRIVHLRAQTPIKTVADAQPPVKETKHATARVPRRTAVRYRARHRHVRARDL
jgi:peptidoglycan/xylan/chitin deacetylase (PgdA/CDA1 family)